MKKTKCVEFKRENGIFERFPIEETHIYSTSNMDNEEIRKYAKREIKNKCGIDIKSSPHIYLSTTFSGAFAYFFMRVCWSHNGIQYSIELPMSSFPIHELATINSSKYAIDDDNKILIVNYNI